MDKVFGVAGVSTLEGVVKARFAKDMGRVKVLEKNGHTAVRLVELPTEMSKEDALVWLRAHADFQDAEAQAAFAPEVEKPAKEPKAAKAPKAVATPAGEPDVTVVGDAPVVVPKAKAAKAPKAKAEPKVDTEVDEIRAKNRELMRQTFEKIRERAAEEAEERAALAAETKELEVDNHMSAFLV